MTLLLEETNKVLCFAVYITTRAFYELAIGPSEKLLWHIMTQYLDWICPQPPK